MGQDGKPVVELVDPAIAEHVRQDVQHAQVWDDDCLEAYLQSCEAEAGWGPPPTSAIEAAEGRAKQLKEYEEHIVASGIAVPRIDPCAWWARDVVGESGESQKPLHLEAAVVPSPAGRTQHPGACRVFGG